MDDMPAEERVYPPTPSKLSKTPSWVMLGFILGALFVWMLPHDEKPAAPPEPVRKIVPPEPARTALTTLTTIEAVFEAWGKYAVWDNELTEVALWNSTTGSFSECYEVKRSGDALHYRSILKLTHRPITDRRKISESPLLFTETEEQYRNWLEHGRSEPPPPPPTLATPEPSPVKTPPKI